MRLDSFAYRLLWRLKRRLRFSNCGPPPIIWRASPFRTYEPPFSFRKILVDENALSKLDILLQELKLFARLTTRLPVELTDRDWRMHFKLETVRERFDHLLFLHNRYRHRQKELQNKEQKKKDRREYSRRKNLETQEVIPWKQPKLINLRTSNIERLDRLSAHLRCVRAFQMEGECPRVALDCRWLHHHSIRGMNLTLIQLRNLLYKNLDRTEPWPIYLCNLNMDDKLLAENRERHLSFLNSDIGFFAHLTPESYLNLFPELVSQKKVVYLSPHSKEPLESVYADTCYVVGAIVDRVREPNIPFRASSVTAEQEGLVCRRFPIDNNKLLGGNPMLTLGAVLNILQDVFDSGGDWESAFERHIPKRKFRLPEEKNLFQIARYANWREHNREISRIVQELTDKHHCSSPSTSSASAAEAETQTKPISAAIGGNWQQRGRSLLASIHRGWLTQFSRRQFSSKASRPPPSSSYLDKLLRQELERVRKGADASRSIDKKSSTLTRKIIFGVLTAITLAVDLFLYLSLQQRVQKRRQQEGGRIGNVEETEKGEWQNRMALAYLLHVIWMAWFWLYIKKGRL